MAKRLNKRFYKTVTLDSEAGLWHVLLDGMQLRTPGKIELAVPSKSLAEILAAEWDAQAEYVNPCLLYTSPSPRDKRQSRMPSSA